MVEHGLASSITGSSVTRAGGGGGGVYDNRGAVGAGGSGGGGAGGNNSNSYLGGSGTANTGSGGGGGGQDGSSAGAGGSGGSGIIIIRAPGAASFSVGPATNTVTTLPAPAGGCKVATFTVSGMLTT
jgi:hypothetical protein